MNKTELVEAVASKTGYSKNACETTVKALIEAVEETLQKGDSVSLIGFGTFSASKRTARVGHNPRTGEEVKIPACVMPKFKAGKSFKEFVNTKPKKSKK